MLGLTLLLITCTLAVNVTSNKYHHFSKKKKKLV